MAQPGLDLPYGFKDARVVLLTQAIIGEFFQGMPLPGGGMPLAPLLAAILPCAVYDALTCTIFCRGSHLWVECTGNHAEGPGKL